MSSHLAPHDWDQYGKPTPRDVELPAANAFKCEHGQREFGEPLHSTVEEERAALKGELDDYEYNARQAQEDLDEAEEAAEETRALLRKLDALDIVEVERIGRKPEPWL